jgi:hypothetical protein
LPPLSPRSCPRPVRRAWMSCRRSGRSNSSGEILETQEGRAESAENRALAGQPTDNDTRAGQCGRVLDRRAGRDVAGALVLLTSKGNGADPRGSMRGVGIRCEIDSGPNFSDPKRASQHPASLQRLALPFVTTLIAVRSRFGSTGLIRCAENPAARESARSSS